MNLPPDLDTDTIAQFLTQNGVPLAAYKLVRLANGEYNIHSVQDGVEYIEIIENDALYEACQQFLLTIGTPVEDSQPAH